VNRRIALIIAALVVPGGFIALVGAWVFRAASRTERGRKWLGFVREKAGLGRRTPVPVPALAPVRHAA
jgi:hypothetical protein